MSFQLTITPHRRAAAKLVAQAHRKLAKAFADAPDVTQTEIASTLGVHRSVINRQMRGQADISLSRVAEIACVLGYDADIVLSKNAPPQQGSNVPTGFTSVTQSTAAKSTLPPAGEKLVFENV